MNIHEIIKHLEKTYTDLLLNDDWAEDSSEFNWLLDATHYLSESLNSLYACRNCMRKFKEEGDSK